MNIVFFGSSHFAVPSLEAASNAGYNISCVVTQPDRKMGRHLYLESTAIKKLSNELGIEIFQSQDINSEESLNFLRGLNADLFVVISYGQILSKEILGLPKKIALNSHASLLPKYRGAAPINWAIIRGEKITGITIIKMTERLDAGPIISKKEIEIFNNDTSLILKEKLSHLAAEMLLETIRDIEKNDYQLTLQDESRVTLAPKLKKEDGLINWNSCSKEIYNLVRGSLIWPGAFTYYKGKMLKIYEAGVCESSGLPGQIIQVSKEGIIAAAARGGLIIKELQIEGKRRMSAGEFIAGHKINIGERFVLDQSIAYII
ncbi:MAG: methionyl-tRNA formyltransferase [Candidatus Omnitrophota bacterium]|nr:methionyl-tRNA formyltransferase [Candidatus Omnitrophota bacterium]